MDLFDITPIDQTLPKVFQFSRKLSIAPYQEILDESQPMAFSGSNSSTWPSYHNSRGTVLVNLRTGHTSIREEGEIMNFITYILHGIGMLILVGLCRLFVHEIGIAMPIGMYIARFHPNYDNWLALHEFIMGLIVPDILSLAVIAFITNVVDSGQGVFSSHALVGYTCGILLAISSISGYFSTLIPSPKHIRAHSIMRVFHKSSTLVVFPLLVANSYLGATALLVYIPGTSPVFAIIPVILPLLTISVAFAFRKYIQKTRVIDGQLFEKNLQVLPEYDWEEIEGRVSTGSKWIVLSGTLCMQPYTNSVYRRRSEVHT